MHIRKVVGNVKKGCDVELGQKTLIVGPNGSGKSTIVNTVELALTARAGDIAGRVDIAREADVMSLAQNGAGELEALATFDDGVVAAYRTSGSTARRFGMVTASARSRPSFTYGSALFTVSVIRFTTPAAVSTSEGALPLYGMCVICRPSAEASAAVARCVIVPVPEEP
jgi:ABC-type cobalamin/Fe3+-siderophores transport system ATPase subunit